MHARSRKGFSLVEMLTVIAVIAILVTILVPTIGNVLDGARKTTAASNLRQIAMAYQAYAQNNGQPRTLTADDVHQWALELAEANGFNDARIYIVPGDPLVENALATESMPTSVGGPGESNAWALTDSFDDFPVSFCVVSQLASNADPSTTPVAWTRGLQADGTWRALDDENPGVYGAEGGHVAYLDGHVVFYENLQGANGEGLLRHYTTKQSTTNISEAISPGARILEFSPANGTDG